MDAGSSVSRASSNGQRLQQPWHWLPTIADTPPAQPSEPHCLLLHSMHNANTRHKRCAGSTMSCHGCAGPSSAGLPAQDGVSWQQPWRLRTNVVHQWRAFPERLHALAASEDEVTIVTAGPCSIHAISMVGGLAEVQILDCRTLNVGTFPGH